MKIKMAANAFDGQCIAMLKNRHPWVEYAVHTHPKRILRYKNRKMGRKKMH